MSADPPTLWHATAEPAVLRPAAKGAQACDLLVIGGGFTGLSTALHAAEAGLRVVVLEGERIAWGASGRNAGFVVPNLAKVDPAAALSKLGPERGAALNRFAGESADLVFDLIRRHGIACDAQQSGWMQPATTAAAFAQVKSRAKDWAALGRPVEVLDARAVTERSGIAGYVGGWVDHSGGVLNPVGYARGLARAAAAAGAKIFEDSPVCSLIRHGADWQAKTAKATITARRVVLATNAHVGVLHPELARSFFPLRVFQIATEPLPAAMRAILLPGVGCLSDTRRNLFTARLDAAGRLISGGMHILGPGAETRVPNTIHRRLAKMLNQPDLPPLQYAWSGTAAVMPDFLPHLLEPEPGLIAAYACNGRGIAMTTRTGATLARWAVGEPASALELPFGPPAPIPFHALLRHAPNALLPLSMWRDRREGAG